MPQYQFFRRIPVPEQFEQHLKATTLPAPLRGIVQSENESYMQPGGAIAVDNWAPTLRGMKLRGGTIRHCDLHALSAPIWLASHAYIVGDIVYDSEIAGYFYQCAVAHTSGGGSFAQDRQLHPGNWTVYTGFDAARLPVISAFEYIDGNNQRMYAAQATTLFDVTAALPVVVKSGQSSGNYSFAQMSNMGANWGIAVNDAGNPPLRYNGNTNTWITLDGTPPTDGASDITGASGLTYVWKYRNRLFFIQGGTMDAWYLPIDAVGGALAHVPLSGAATLGGSLLFGAVYSTDAGDGFDDKCVFVTTLGEVLVFSGTNPGDPNNWKQEGRWRISPPLGMNGHIQVGGDLLVLCVDGIIPLSQALTKDASQLELAMLTRTIKPLWRENVDAKRAHPWTIKKWDEYGAIFVTTPGGPPGDRWCLIANNVTIAWARFSYDAMCFIRMGADLFFGTQDGLIMQAERSGYDDADAAILPYACTLVGGWEMFGAPANQIHLRQMRAVFHSGNAEPFQPQLSASTDYVVTIPPMPPVAPDPGLLEVWDEGLWGAAVGAAHWDSPAPPRIAPVRNSMWQSIGETGFAHAPVVQVTMGQRARPNVELIALGCIYEAAGVNV